MKKYWPKTAKINDKGNLEIGGCDVANIAAQFGTPLYIIDEQDLRIRCQEYKKSFSEGYSDVFPCYASKALSNIEILKIIKQEGFGLDVVSGGELYTAIRSDFDMSKVYFHGNNKNNIEIKEGVRAGVNFVVDSFEELEILNSIAGEHNWKVPILVRINPGIEAHTHEYIQTGKIDSKFGIALKDAERFVELAQTKEHIDFMGFHSHIGSQIFDIKPFLKLVEVLLQLSAKVIKEHRANIRQLSLGGGIGICYTDKDNPATIEIFASKITKEFNEQKKKQGVDNLKLIIEPGRSIIGNAGVTLYSVGVIKDIPGIRKYISVDGGMADNPRPITYQAEYEADVANKMNEQKTEKVTIAGRYCESGDVLVKDIHLPPVKRDDLVVVYATGAYNYSMASNYNRVPRPGMILVRDGKARVILKREIYEDLTRMDLVEEA